MRLLALLLSLAALGAPWQTHADTGGTDAMEAASYRLDSGKLAIEFRQSNGKLTLARLADSTGANWLRDGNDHPFWRVAFAGPEGAGAESSSATATPADVRERSDSLEIDWHVPLGEGESVITLGVRCPEGGALSYWSIRAKLPDDWRVARVDLPCVGKIPSEDRLKFCAPAGWGLEYDVKPGAGYTGTYPSCLAAMQFCAFYGGGRGLYLAAHDPNANHKVADLKCGDDGATFSFIHWPALPERAGGDWKLPFEVVVGVFDGDYYDAAQIYREFSFTTTWGSAGKVSRRPIPRWVKDTQIWLRPGEEPLENVEPTLSAARFFGVPLSLHRYRWHKIPYDTLYPDYLPPKDGFAEEIRAFQAAGLPVMPYINGRLSDPNSSFWNEERGEQSSARGEKDEPYTEVYGSKVPLNVMCPFTRQWQDKVASLARTLTTEYNVDGVYIDQIGAAHAVRCFDESHGHLPGGGDFWYRGYRTLLERVRAQLPEGKMLTTEENAECWLDQFDALLLVNTTTSEPRIIPLFPSVYSDRAITFGMLYIAHDDFARSLPFLFKMARAYVWGAQLGWCTTDQIMADGAAKEREFLRNLGRARRSASEFLLGGRFLGMIDAYGDNPRIHGEGTGSFGGTYEIDTPSVLASAWQSEEGRLGVLLVNMSAQDRRVEARLPLVQAGLRPDLPAQVEVFGHEGLLESVTCESGMQKLEVPATSALVVRVTGGGG